MGCVSAPFTIMTFRQFIDGLKDFGSIVGILVTLFGVITGIFKPIRKRFITWLRKVVSTDEQDTEIKKSRGEIQNLTKAVNDWVAQQKEHNSGVDKRLDELVDQNTQLRHANYYTLGNVIREVYHENKAAKRLSEHDYDLCDKVYKLYHDEWHQNGPIQAMWEEMQTWEKIFS